MRWKHKLTEFEFGNTTITTTTRNENQQKRREKRESYSLKSSEERNQKKVSEEEDEEESKQEKMEEESVNSLIESEISSVLQLNLSLPPANHLFRERVFLGGFISDFFWGGVWGYIF